MPPLIWPGRLPVDLRGLHLWTDSTGTPCVRELNGLPYAVASTRPSIETADAPAGAVPQLMSTAGQLLDGVPEGHGLGIDTGTASRRTLTPEQIDGVRGPEPPRGDEEYATAAPVPRHLRRVVEDARRSARASGATRTSAAWARLPGGAAGLIVTVRGRGPGRTAPAEALAAALDAVRRHAPQERVQVVQEAGVTGRLRGRGAAGDMRERACLVACVLVVSITVGIVRMWH